mmetsp:Transcript_3170/g.7009  ORF Transcript_3170/g.7009 Transcript_3170/m.7009 type:complete len:903 (-) Transcript_3170:432-3140(-)|eukprot:CAMPEP_0172324676 /NCGR_PEP_ID=MMETSP1058-20130122/51951_1 /TAXON_ID=83371 /ORGANISM="Detonula confervacea, Strain CCMP 353" /LENGTH=902 /DNA_ID=CAMNT_0013041017 /DNA_START=125 /DNA_END=2833 /DNA_ORIENTATION=-
MDKQEQVQQDHSLAGVLLAGEVEALAGIATDAATLNSDAAVGGSVGGGSGERQRRSVSSSSAAASAAVVTGGGSLTASNVAASGKRNGDKSNHINSYARQRHYRKRALSTAGFSSGTIETSGSMADAIAEAAGQGNANSRTLVNSAMGSNSSSAEHSIVSFGLNFNFDSTSSPSNSDSGEAGAVNDGKGGEGSSEDDNNGNANGQAPAAQNNGVTTNGALTNAGGGEKKKVKTPSPKNKSNTQDNNMNKGGGKSASGSNEGKNSKGSRSKNSRAKKHTSVTFDPNANVPPATNNGEEGSGSSMSSCESSGGSASGGSSSGNDGSSGGKSTVSSLTTSSNQEWMNTNESAEAAAQANNNASGVEVTKQQSGAGGATRENGGTDGKDPSAKKKDALSGKKRKTVTISMAATTDSGGATEKKNKAKGDEGGNEDDDGYKTDEEQWGGNRNAAIDGTSQGGSACLPGQGPMATHKVSLLKASSSSKRPSNSNGSNEGPPMKQARFSIDCDQHHIHEHPPNVQSADASAQPLSSLSGSDSAVVPAVMTTSGGGQMHGLLSNSSGAAAAISSNPSSSAGSTPIHAASALNQMKAHAASSGPDKRKERNAREKERSCRIAMQIDELRTLLSRGGVTVSKGTKSSVLSEAASYINILQQQQVQWEMDRQAMMQQMQQIGVSPNPNVGQQNMPQNDMSMGMPAGQNMDPQAAVPQQMALVQQGLGLPVQELPGQQIPMNPMGQAANANAINTNDYKFIFGNSCVGMAIASLGGAFVDCNPIFCQLSEFTKDEICAMTIFNMTSRQDLQQAFDLISQMITPTLDNGADKGEDKSSIVLRGAMKKRADLGLSVSLIKGDHGIAKCFCVTLVRILSIESTRPDTVSIEMELPQVWSTKQQTNVGFGASPAYTTG